MPLDLANGENIEGIGIGNVATVDKWASTQFFGLACDYAEQSFIKAGALQPIEFANDEILVMEYPSRERLAFVFSKKIAGKEMLFPFVVKLDPSVISELVNSGRWTRPN